MLSEFCETVSIEDSSDWATVTKVDKLCGADLDLDDDSYRPPLL